MGLSWSKIVNVVKKTFQVAEKTFITVEPYAVTVLNIAGQKEAGAVIGTIYNVVTTTETNLASQTGQTKLQTAQTAIQSAALPMLQLTLEAAGKTIDMEAANNATTLAINAVVAENNAQAQVAELIGASTSSGKSVDPVALADAQAGVAKASAAVIAAGTSITAAIKSVQSNKSAQPAAPPA